MELAAAHYANMWDFISRNIGWIIFFFVMFGSAVAEFFGNVLTGVASVLTSRGEIRHQRRLELAKASRVKHPAGRRKAPGPCRHYRVTPVVGVDDEVKAWLCRNPDCAAQLPADYAVREEDL
jgi:hypothetical protein